MLAGGKLGGLNLFNLPAISNNFLGKDEFFESIQLLLHGNSPSISDSSLQNRVINAYNGAQISTGQLKFPPSSIYFNGTNSYLEVVSSNNSDFKFLHDGSDYTLETFLYPASLSSAEQIIFDTCGYASVNTGTVVSITNTGAVIIYTARGVGTVPAINFTSVAGTIQANIFSHLAITCKSGIVTLFVNGISKGSATYFAPSNANPTYPNPFIGTWHNNNGSLFFDGYLDEFRITKDISRYDSNFNPPTNRFSNN